MPYIEQGSRSEMDKVVDLMKELKVGFGGDLEYILGRFCKEFVKPSYNNYKNFCGELDQCAVEIERRFGKSQIFFKSNEVVKDRKEFDKVVKLMKELKVKVNGDLNYILFKFFKVSKFSSNNFIKSLERTKEGIQKYLLAPYEDMKIKQNGDVY